MPNAVLATSDETDNSRKGVATAKLVRLPGAGPTLWRFVVAINIVGMMLVAATLRCRDLGNLPGINGDEAWYGVQAELCLRGEPIAWRTPSGNLLNPLFFGPQLAMHAVFGPSFAVLRATAVASGLLALFVNFWLCRHVFGPKIAVISTSILAVLPVDIAYSRLAWDASQSLLATLPCIYLPLWAIVDHRLKLRCSMAALAALVLAVVVHPTNLFVAPIAMVCLGYAWREELRQIGRRIAGWCPEKCRRMALIAAAAAVVAIGLSAISANAGLRRAWLWPAIERAANPPQYAEFLANFGRLFSGAGVYEYLSGEMIPPTSLTASNDNFRSDCVPYDIAAWIVGVWLVWGMAHAMRHKRPELVCLSIGWGAGLFGFFLVAGPGALAPNLERYAIWIVGPAAILAAVVLGSWQARPGRTGRISALVAMALGWVLLIGFQSNCLGFLQQTGGRSHQTFRTAAVEPKQAALDYILDKSQPRQTVRVVTSEWWIYWPMRYLSIGPRSRGADSRLSFELRTSAIAATPIPADLQRGQTWIVEFTDSAACKAIRQAARSSDAPLQETKIDDFSGHALVSLFAVGSTNRENVHKTEKN